MKEFKGSKGKWQAEGDLVHYEGCIVAEVSLGKLEIGSTKEERQRVIEANAQLIATAPELLEALQKLVSTFDYTEQAMYSFASKEIDKAKETINKALGE